MSIINFLYKLISSRKKSGVYRFYKESRLDHVSGYQREWYIDLPKYPGPKAALQMVAGADYLLDVLSEGKDEVKISLSLTQKENHCLKLCTTEQTTYGRWYWYENHALWLCPVVVYVFGYYPETIYFKVL